MGLQDISPGADVNPPDFRLDIAASSPYFLFPIWRAGRRLRRQLRQVRKEATVTVVPGVRLSESAKLQALRFFISPGSPQNLSDQNALSIPLDLHRALSAQASPFLFRSWDVSKHSRGMRWYGINALSPQSVKKALKILSLRASRQISFSLPSVQPYQMGVRGIQSPGGVQGAEPLIPAALLHLPEAAILSQLTSGPSGGYKGLQNRRVGGPFQGVPCVYS